MYAVFKLWAVDECRPEAVVGKLCAGQWLKNNEIVISTLRTASFSLAALIPAMLGLNVLLDKSLSSAVKDGSKSFIANSFSGS